MRQRSVRVTKAIGLRSAAGGSWVEGKLARLGARDARLTEAGVAVTVVCGVVRRGFGSRGRATYETRIRQTAAIEQ